MSESEFEPAKEKEAGSFIPHFAHEILESYTALSFGVEPTAGANPQRVLARVVAGADSEIVLRD